MSKSTQKPGFRLTSTPKVAGPLDTLALQVTSPEIGEPELRLNQSAKFAAKGNFTKRARVKYLTTALTLRLADVVGSKLNKAYWNTFYCSSLLQKKGDELTGKYCKNRWCLVCSRIRTAQLIKQYLPLLQGWSEKQFVTLTVPNCAGADLVATIAAMKGAFDTIRRRFTMQHRRGHRSAPLVALRKLECTYNPRRKDYHPHFHLIVQDAATAHELRALWLEQFPSASWDGQDVRPATDSTVLELFKYFTKLVTSKEVGGRCIDVAPLNVIFEAISGARTFWAFGVKTTKETTDEEANALAEKLETETVYEWDQAATDWVDKSTGELLTGYSPDDEFRKLVETKIIHFTKTKTQNPCYEIYHN